jgi:hypothetical protein
MGSDAFFPARHAFAQVLLWNDVYYLEMKANAGRTTAKSNPKKQAFFTGACRLEGAEEDFGIGSGQIQRGRSDSAISGRRSALSKAP